MQDSGDKACAVLFFTYLNCFEVISPLNRQETDWTVSIAVIVEARGFQLGLYVNGSSSLNRVHAVKEGVEFVLQS